jgi:hypothetical protein
MYYTRKLKPPLLGTEMILGIVVTVVFMVLIVLSYPLAMSFGALITFSASILSLIVYSRTRNNAFLIGVIAHLLATAFLIQISLGLFHTKGLYIILTAALMLAFQTLMIIYGVQKKMKWRSREILELAAQNIEGESNSFTNRPMHIGQADYSPDLIHSFSNFIRKNLIAVPVRERERIVFIINMPWEKFISYNRQYWKFSYVAFDYEGDVSVNITQQDYFMYRDQLAFDGLCQSMGSLLISFLEKYKKGEEIWIIDQFNALKLNIIIEG